MPNTKWALKNLPKTFKIVLKCGNTAHEQRGPHERVHGEEREKTVLNENLVSGQRKRFA